MKDLDGTEIHCQGCGEFSEKMYIIQITKRTVVKIKNFIDFFGHSTHDASFVLHREGIGFWSKYCKECAIRRVAIRYVELCPDFRASIIYDFLALDEKKERNTKIQKRYRELYHIVMDRCGYKNYSMMVCCLRDRIYLKGKTPYTFGENTEYVVKDFYKKTLRMPWKGIIREKSLCKKKLEKLEQIKQQVRDEMKLVLGKSLGLDPDLETFIVHFLYV